MEPLETRAIHRLSAGALAVVLSLALPPVGRAADGDLDKSFNQTGQVNLPGPEGGYLRTADLKIQKDGKVLVLGTAQILTLTLPPSVVSDVQLVRLQKNGAPDPSFAGDGVVVTDFDNRSEIVREMEVQSDGKIVVVGMRDVEFSLGNVSDFFVMRYAKSGELDPSFGLGKGYVTVDVDAGDDLQAVVLQKDKKILCAGWTIHANGGHSLALLRLLPDGRRDPDFGPLHDGVVTTLVEGQPAIGFGVALQADGRILVTGVVGEAESGSEHAFVGRFLPDGRPDESFAQGERNESFDDDGFLVLEEPGLLGTGADVLVQKDGRILVGGGLFTSGGTKGSVFVYRLVSDGKRDKTWGKNGLAKIQFSSRAPSGGGGMALGPSGKLTVIGTSGLPPSLGPAGAAIEAVPQQQLGIARLLTNGKLDTSFGTKGKKLFTLDPAGGGGLAVALQKDGKIVVGSQIKGLFDSQMAVTRHLAKPK